MNIQSLLIVAVALTLGLSACNKEETLSQDGAPVNAVQITASVGNPFAATRSNPVGTVAEQAQFNIGDEIVVDKISIVRNAPRIDGIVYQFNGTNWITNDNKYLLWQDDIQSFDASYPVDQDGSPIYYVQQDQSLLAQLALSDLMYATVWNTRKGTVLNFVMERQTSRIIVNIAGFNPEFPVGSVVTDVKIVIDNSLSSEPSRYLTPYTQGVEGSIGNVGTTYTLLADAYMDNMHVSLKVDDKEMKSPALQEMEIGKSYTYNLNVGKEKLEIGSVTVADWTNTIELPGGEAEEDFYD